MPLGLGPFLDQIVTLILQVVAVLGGIHLYKRSVNPSPPAGAQISPVTPAASHSTAEETLKERYARGEIDRARYLEILENLKAQSSGESAKRTASLSAEEIARESYARGELDRAQFQEMMEDLKKDRP
jgi:uncharacterized membrane protein